MGMQEPASAFASVLNFAANFYMFKKLRREFPYSMAHRMPIAIFYQAYAMVSEIMSLVIITYMFN